jgi:hypothetical protein
MVSARPEMPTTGRNGTANGVNGSNGSDSMNGMNGSNGINGLNIMNGSNAVHGSNGVNGTNGVNGSPSPSKENDIPIAIIGMSCRLPGDVSSPQEFWELLSRARSGWSKIPKERFNSAAFHHPNPEKLGCYNPIGGHFLNGDLGLFDAPFFNVTEQEAISMDPQQRLLLECTFEAAENGGIPKEKLIGKNVGKFSSLNVLET